MTTPTSPPDGSRTTTSGPTSSTDSSTTPLNNPSPFPHGAFLPNGLNTDPPLAENDPTIGYKLNHLMLRIRDPKASMKFYVELMGMRTVFTMNVGPFTIYYLGYPQTFSHRSDLPTFGQETSANLQHTLGLLELYHVHGTESLSSESPYYSTGNTPPNLGFGHLGFTVPDVPSVVERLSAAGVPVVKPLRVSDTRNIPISSWEESNGIGVGEIHENYAAVFKQIAFVQDPDGYIIELVPQRMDPLAP